MYKEKKEDIELHERIVETINKGYKLSGLQKRLDLEAFLRDINYKGVK